MWEDPEVQLDLNAKKRTRLAPFGSYESGGGSDPARPLI
jgi:hypothetical protein